MKEGLKTLPKMSDIGRDLKEFWGKATEGVKDNYKENIQNIVSSTGVGGEGFIGAGGTGV